MMRVRPVKKDDLDDLFELSKLTGSGLTTLPNDRDVLKTKIEESLSAFREEPGPKEKKYYLLVMDDLKNNKVVGTAGLATGVGYDRPFYTYRHLHVTQESTTPPVRVDTSLLQISNDYVGATEVMSLFLHPDYRKDLNGRLLSKARYMLIAADKERFNEQVISEIRGWVDENDISPFWEAIGRPFFQMDFTEADRINGEGNHQFISDLMPRCPIYTCMLPQNVRDVIGKPHDLAIGAYKLLIKEGFRAVNAVDIFDGGPTLVAQRDQLWTLIRSQKETIAGFTEQGATTPTTMVANTSLENFAVTLADVLESSGGVWLPSDCGQALSLNPGDNIIFAPIHAQ